MSAERAPLLYTSFMQHPSPYIGIYLLLIFSFPVYVSVFSLFPSQSSSSSLSLYLHLRVCVCVSVFISASLSLFPACDPSLSSSLRLRSYIRLRLRLHLRPPTPAHPERWTGSGPPASRAVDSPITVEGLWSLVTSRDVRRQQQSPTEVPS